MAEEWTKEQADQITALYGQLKGEYEKKANQKLFGGPQLPYEQARSILNELLENQKKELAKKGGLEQKMEAASSRVLSEKAPYVVGLAGILGGTLALGAGVATAGILGFLVAGAAVAYLYSKTPKESYKPA